MRTFLPLVLAAFVALPVHAQAPPEVAEEAPAHVASENEQFEAAFGRQDAAALAALYADDAILFTRHAAPTVGGRTGVRQYWEAFFGMGYDAISLSTVESRSADGAVADMGIATVRRDGEVALVADYTTLWTETGDGWKIQYDIKFRTSGGAETTSAGDVTWAEIVPGVSFGAVHGDWQAEAHSKLVRIDAGAAVPMHVHTHPYRGVVLEGRLTNPYPGESSPTAMGPGDSWFVPGGVAHSNACVSEEPCLFYTHADALWDVQLVED